MPCLYISTNVNLDGVDKDPIFSEATKAVASIIGRPEHVSTLYHPSGLSFPSISSACSCSNSVACECMRILMFFNGDPTLKDGGRTSC
ncbi:hypothetical protein OIU84_025869 [Salix udensis]|uniref:Uncharacterized protein n=1 Tax=Salix udensis TaxID=889485 RepID=A0AAD6KKL1_9ROSI|nr:hypothetical protein OIU84_025869 [Salix udensis]